MVPPYSFMGADTLPGSAVDDMAGRASPPGTGSLAGPLAQYEMVIDTGNDPTVEIERPGRPAIAASSFTGTLQDEIVVEGLLRCRDSKRLFGGWKPRVRSRGGALTRRKRLAVGFRRHPFSSGKPASN